MGLTYLLDSNVLIDYTSRKFSLEVEIELDKIFDSTFHYSVISKLEVLGYQASESELSNLEEFLLLGVMYPITEEIANRCIQIRRNSPRTKLPDAIIAASAIANRHILVTSNISDFDRIKGLTVVTPASLYK
ncbi:MAG: type II toxin-antitoxin system VapC family toxin [Cyclobacteriaceae bacterium]|nr:type II toxin-antitoxin system VapC family toxin [Cyclobacteriaceae bacterium]